MAHTATLAVTETVEIESLEAACDGGPSAEGHPRVYLHLDPDTHDTVCPYCSRRFVLKPGATPSAH